MTKKMKVTRYNPEEIEAVVTDISLLTLEEAKALPENIRQYRGWWWLRTPGDERFTVAFVYNGGSVNSYGTDIGYNYNCVRPVLTIADLDFFDLEVGDTLAIQNKRYIYIGDNRVIYNGELVYHRFDEDSNDYEKSEIKKIVDNWLGK